MVARLRNSFLALLLGLLSVLVVKAICFLDLAEVVLSNVQGVVTTVGPSLTAAALELRGVAREQRRYLKADTKARAILMAESVRTVRDFHHRGNVVLENANQALANFDHRAEELAKGGIAMEDHAVELLEHATTQVDHNGYETGLALAAMRSSFEQLERLGPPMHRAAINVEQSTESVKIALEPLRTPTGRLKWVLRWLLGLPKINVR